MNWYKTAQQPEDYNSWLSGQIKYLSDNYRNYLEPRLVEYLIEQTQGLNIEELQQFKKNNMKTLYEMAQRVELAKKGFGGARDCPKELVEMFASMMKDHLHPGLVLDFMSAAPDKDRMAAILGHKAFNMLNDDRIEYFLRGYDNDVTAKANILITYKQNLTGMGVYRILSAMNIYANNTGAIKNIFERLGSKEISKMDDTKMGELICYDHHGGLMTELLIKHVGHNFNDYLVQTSIHYAKDKEKIIDMLGQENINKMSDQQVHELVERSHDVLMSDIFAQHPYIAEKERKFRESTFEKPKMPKFKILDI